MFLKPANDKGTELSSNMEIRISFIIPKIISVCLFIFGLIDWEIFWIVFGIVSFLSFWAMEEINNRQLK